MKAFLALSAVLFAAVGLAPIASAGPERLEAKEMAPPPPVSALCNWTGFYVGAHVGCGWGDLTWTDTDTSTFSPGSPPEGPDLQGPETLVEHSPSGVIGGGQLGYNYQIGSFVLGAEGDFSYSDVRKTSSNNGTEPISDFTFRNDFETRNDWVGTLGLRAGFTWHHFLFYAKGGAAFAHLEYSLHHAVLDEPGNPVDVFEADELRVGPMVGGGVEYALTCHWSVKIEYSHLFLGAEDVTGTNVEASATGAESETYEIDTNQNSVRLGLNYKF